jgi:hypothetical protein
MAAEGVDERDGHAVVPVPGDAEHPHAVPAAQLGDQRRVVHAGHETEDGDPDGPDREVDDGRSEGVGETSGVEILHRQPVSLRLSRP